MTISWMEMLIRSYRAFANLVAEIEPVISGDIPATVSFAQYIKNFCLAIITRADAENMQHRYFINNLTLISLPEMSEEEYRQAITGRDSSYYDAYLYGKQDITQKLLNYDLANRTKLMQLFSNHLCVIAGVFAAWRSDFKQPILDFSAEYSAWAKGLVVSDGVESANGNWAPRQDPARTQDRLDQKTEAVSQPTKKVNQTFPSSPGSTLDVQYWLRVMLPAISILALVVGALVTEEWALILVALIPLGFLIAGIKAARKRCPSCGAWGSMITVRSNCIGQQKVKVRRNLNSIYYRTSGTYTFGARQVFVSADEYTYSEVYRCSICGHQTSGMRRSIDDGIR